MLHRPSWLKRSENDCCRLAAATALDKIGNAPALQALANRAEGERSEAIRRLALGARARLGPATGAPAPGERNVSHAT
jgi:HEAT repeat protein